ncbi:MAG: hypothetical protein Q8941_12370 [Bacteroidota bacterium]|nr:hypothetical protein [Bacteroidota bacterium]
MRSILISAIPLLIFSCIIHAQQPSAAWNKYKWLIGNWEGEGDGKPGDGKGWFSLQEDLSGKILVRKNHSEYPAKNEKPGIIHDDLMIVYPGPGMNSLKAIYFDNEGHTLQYSVSSTDSSVVFISDKIPDSPVFRLTYKLINNGSITIKFEISPDGEKFNTYTEGRCRRKE